MSSNVTAATYAADNGSDNLSACTIAEGWFSRVPCVIANGFNWRSIFDIIEGHFTVVGLLLVILCLFFR